MSLACKILASFLLISVLSSKATDLTQVHGILNRDISLSIAGFAKHDEVDDILWFQNSTKIARFQRGKTRSERQEKYELSSDGTLKIKHLQKNDHCSYKVIIYDADGQEIFTRIFDLRILESVSKPKISWSCTNTTLTCEVTNGTDPKLKLYQDGRSIKEGQKVITYKWTTKQNTSFKCIATNKISKETSVADPGCAETGLDIYLITGICGGGVLFLLFVSLLILFVSKRRKAHRRRNEEELEIRAHRMTSEERSQKPRQIPASAPQNPAASQLPPPPSHRPKTHGHRPPPPGHRAQNPHQHQQQKRPLPPPGTQARQQKGPPLPRPRVQPTPPRGAAENS